MPLRKQHILTLISVVLYVHCCIVHAGVFVCCSIISGASCCCWWWCSHALLGSVHAQMVFRLKLYSCPLWTGFLVIKDNLRSFLRNKVSVYVQGYSPKHRVYSHARAYLLADYWWGTITLTRRGIRDSSMEPVRKQGAFTSILFSLKHVKLGSPKLHFGTKKKKNLNSGNLDDTQPILTPSLWDTNMLSYPLCPSGYIRFPLASGKVPQWFNVPTT